MDVLEDVFVVLGCVFKKWEFWNKVLFVIGFFGIDIIGVVFVILVDDVLVCVSIKFL